MTTLHVACSFDDRYAVHFAVLAASLAASKGSEQIQVTALSDGSLSEGYARELHTYLATLDIAFDLVRIPPSRSEQLPAGGAYPRIIWNRLLLPELLPDVERVLYLDADTLALQSLVPLFASDLGPGHVLGGVATPVTGWEWHYERLGLSTEGGYFNSGVLLMDLHEMRRSGFTEHALAVASSTEPLLIWPDQDVLNLAASGRWTRLHPRWNAVSYLWLERHRADGRYPELDLELARSSPAIVQFEGHPTVKPWSYRSLHPLRGLYRELRAGTPWPLTELEGKTLVTRVLRRLPLRHQYLISAVKSRLVRR